jgi:MFS family permease
VKKTKAAKPAPQHSRFGQLLQSHYKWVLLLVVVHVALAFLTLEPAPHTGGDNAGYLSLAKSLLQRHQYRDIYDPAAPLHTQYPPVFPIILAIALTLGVKPWLQLKLLTIAFSGLAVAFSYLWIRRLGRPELALGVAAVLALSPGIIGQSHWELSDVPFWAMTMVAVYAWEKLPPETGRRFILAIVFTTLAYFTRSAGLPLLIAAAAWLAMNKRWRPLAIFAAVILPLAFMWWLRAKSQGGVDYVSQFWSLDPYTPAKGRIHFFDLFTRAGDNGGRYVTRHLPMLLFGVEGLLPLSVLVLMFGVYGWAKRIRRPGVAELFLPLYIGLLLVWPAVWSGERFLLPAMPFILFYAGDALLQITGKVMPAAARLTAAIVAVVVVVIGIPATGRAMAIGRECMAIYHTGDRYACLPQQYKDYYHLAEVAPRVLPDHSAVISRKSRSFFVMSGLSGRQFPLDSDPEKFFAEAADAHARYVVFDQLDNLSMAYLAPILLARSHAFCVVLTLGPERAALFGIDAARGALPPQANAGEGAFAQCGPEYYRNAAVKDSVSQGLIRIEE